MDLLKNVLRIIVSIYIKVVLLFSEFSDSLKQSLVKGWPILGRLKDDADEDWSTWRHFILQTLSGWIIVNYVGAQAIEFLNIKVRLNTNISSMVKYAQY